MGINALKNLFKKQKPDLAPIGYNDFNIGDTFYVLSGNRILRRIVKDFYVVIDDQKREISVIYLTTCGEYPQESAYKQQADVFNKFINK